MPTHEAGRSGGPAVTPELVSRWCAQCTVPGHPPELSDAAAVAIASGHLSPQARAVVLRRMSAGLPVPAAQAVIGAPGFAELRRLNRSIAVIDEQLASPLLPGVVAAVVRARRGTLAKRLDEARRVVVGGKGVFATSLRGVRRERRDGTHLELTDRERLFSGLSYTPTADLTSGGYVRRAGSAARDRLVLAAEAAAERAGRGKWLIAELFGDATGAPPSADARFVDGYETVLFVAGSFVDRVTRCPAWHSEHFSLQRSQVDLHTELADIATDVIALRSIRVDLDASRAAAGFDAGLEQHIAGREASLRPVWRELLERTAALASVAEVVESAAVELRVLAEFTQTATIDERIDDLVGRSGMREMSADNSRRVTEQVRAGEEQLRIYRDVLQGNIARLASTQDRPRLTPPTDN